MIAIENAGWPVESEALQTVQAIIKLSFMTEWARVASGPEAPCHVQLLSAGQPPSTLLAWTAAEGIEAVVRVGDEQQAVIGRRATIAGLLDGRPDVDALQGANASAFAQAHGLDFAVASMARVDELLTARRVDAGLGPDDESATLEDGDLQVRAGAYAGEVIRRALGRGHWRYPAAPHGTVTFKTGLVTVNLIDKALKFLRQGSYHSMAGLVAAVIAEPASRAD